VDHQSLKLICRLRDGQLQMRWPIFAASTDPAKGPDPSLHSTVSERWKTRMNTGAVGVAPRSVVSFTVSGVRIPADWFERGRNRRHGLAIAEEAVADSLFDDLSLSRQRSPA
jgi:hypothetical protein